MLDQQSTVTQYLQNLTLTNKCQKPCSLQNKQFHLLIDMLCRRERCHLLLTGMATERYHQAIAGALAQFLISEHAPAELRTAQVFYCDIAEWAFSNEKPEDIVGTLLDLSMDRKQTTIFYFNSLKPWLAENWQGFLLTLLRIKHVKIIVATDVMNQPMAPVLLRYCRKLSLPELSIAEQLLLLKGYRDDWEVVHHVRIPDQILQYALQLASRYLGDTMLLDNTIDLLETALLKVVHTNKSDTEKAVKSVLTNNVLVNILSQWTQIPPSLIAPVNFQLTEFSEALQQRVFGQETAITALGLALQYTYIASHENDGVCTSFIFAGPPGVGKRTCALALAERLYGSMAVVLTVVANDKMSVNRLTDVEVIVQHDFSRLSLPEAIYRWPYAIIIVEDMERVDQALLHLLVGLSKQHRILTEPGLLIDCSHLLMIFITQLGSETITAVVNAKRSQKTPQAKELLELVLNEKAMRHAETVLQHFSWQELNDSAVPVLQEKLPHGLLQTAQLVPFLPLDYTAIEKMIHRCIKDFAQTLRAQYGIELQCAAEAIVFLTRKVLLGKAGVSQLHKLLEHYFYTQIAARLIQHQDHPAAGSRLFVQLNETGEMLYCDFVAADGILLGERLN